jgi:hypothetical protein
MEMSSTNLLWFLAFVFLAGGNGFGGLFGNNRVPMGPPPATQAELTMGLNNQSIMNELNALGLATANNNYETARLISDQNLLMATQNNANQINVIQGFNQIAGKIDALSAQMASCCCEIKTQMLQDRLADAQAKIVSQQATISNNEQTQYLLAQMGKWVANAPATSA